MITEKEKREEMVSSKLNCKKSNILISSKYRSSLLENKILALAMAKAYEEDGRAIAKLSSGELRVLLNKNKGKKISGSFYTQLKNVAYEMAGRKIFIEDVENKSFAVINLVGSASYCDNTFTIKFEPDLKDYLINLKSNYTNLNIAVLMSFEKVYSYRLYELLKSKAYCYGRNYDNDKEYSLCFGISELKLSIGVVDTNAEAVSRALKKPNPDFDHIVNEISKDKNFNIWSDFKKKVIDVAIDEINEKSDLDVRYELVREGYGGKVTKIIFFFKKKENFKSTVHMIVAENENSNQNALINSIRDFVSEPLSDDEINKLLSIADYDISRISQAYELACKQNSIDNLVGWLICAIKNNYTDKTINKIEGMSFEDAIRFNELKKSLQ